MRLLTFLALALVCSEASAACGEIRGGHLESLKSPVIWHARVACGGSTLIWFETFAGKEGEKPAWLVDDLLIVPQLEKAQTLSLFAPVDLECRHHSGKPSLVIAAGEWSASLAPNARQPILRAWRVDPESRKVAEVPIRDVNCVLR